MDSIDTLQIPWGVALLAWLLLGLLNAYWARRRGRSPGVWFFIGMAFGLLALIVLFCLPNLEGESDAERPIEPPLDITPPEEQRAEWFYLDDERKHHGPITHRELLALIEEGTVVTPASYVWQEGMDGWKRWEEL